MKLTDRRLLILLIVIANAAVAFAQSFFSVEEISKFEYTEAEKSVRNIMWFRPIPLLTTIL